MVTSVKTNPPTHTEAKLSGADILRQVVQSAKAARTSALLLCYSAALYILKVSHFTDTKSKDYMTRSDAVAFLQKQIKDQADVQGKMLDIYIRNANVLAGILLGSTKMFSPTIQRIAQAETAESAVEILSDWMEQNNGRRIESMSNLSEALGYKTGRPTPTAAQTPAQVVQRVANTVKNVEKAMSDGKVRVKESEVAKAVVAVASSKLTFAREAIKQITEEDDLRALEQVIKDRRIELRTIAKEAPAKLKARTTELMGGKAPRKRPTGGKSTVQHTQA